MITEMEYLSTLSIIGDWWMNRMGEVLYIKGVCHLRAGWEGER